jgi:hypothetical protein
MRQYRFEWDLQEIVWLCQYLRDRESVSQIGGVHFVPWLARAIPATRGWLDLLAAGAAIHAWTLFPGTDIGGCVAREDAPLAPHLGPLGPGWWIAFGSAKNVLVPAETLELPQSQVTAAADILGALWTHWRESRGRMPEVHLLRERGRFFSTEIGPLLLGGVLRGIPGQGVEIESPVTTKGRPVVVEAKTWQFTARGGEIMLQVDKQGLTGDPEVLARVVREGWSRWVAGTAVE